MWMFTEHGFVSAIRDPRDTSRLAIRARDLESLDPLVSLTHQQVLKTPSGDYPYRVFVEPGDFAGWVAESCWAIDYDNFKSRVARTRGYDYVHALHNVWAAMRMTEDETARTS